MLVTIRRRMLWTRLVFNSYVSKEIGKGDRCTAKTIVKLLSMNFIITRMSSITSKTEDFSSCCFHPQANLKSDVPCVGIGRKAKTWLAQIWSRKKHGSYMHLWLLWMFFGQLLYEFLSGNLNVTEKLTLRELRSLPCLSNRTIFLYCYPCLNSSKKKKHFLLCDIRNNSVCQKLGFLLPFWGFTKRVTI